MHKTLASLIRLNLAINASYSTSLLAALNPNQIAYSISNHSGVVNRSLAPLDEAVDDPSMCKVHSTSEFTTSAGVSYARKYAKICPLIAIFSR